MVTHTLGDSIAAKQKRITELETQLATIHKHACFAPRAAAVLSKAEAALLLLDVLTLIGGLSEPEGTGG